MTAAVMARMTRRRAAVPRVSWRVGRFMGLVLVMLAVTLAGLYQVHQRYELIRLGYQLDEDRFEHRRLLETHKRLRLSLATWKDPTTVRALATDQLGMHRAEAYDEFVVPGASSSIRRPLVPPPPPRPDPAEYELEGEDEALAAPPPGLPPGEAAELLADEEPLQSPLDGDPGPVEGDSPPAPRDALDDPALLLAPASRPALSPLAQEVLP